MSKSKARKRRNRKRKAAKVRSRSSSRRASRKLFDALAEADRLLDENAWDDAGEFLESLDRRWPGRVEVLGRLTEVYYELGDLREHLSTCERLHSVAPNDPDLPLMLAGSYMANALPALACQTFRRFLERWPEDPRRDEIGQTIDGLEEALDELLEGTGLTGEDRFESAALHEQVQRLLQQGEFAELRTVADQLIERHPGFAAPQNNAAEACFRLGEIDEAIARTRRVLQKDPDNYHALSNLTRYLCLSGQVDEAETWAERVKAVESEATDLWVKKGESLCYLGDDEGVLQALRDARKARPLRLPEDALLYHLAAVAAMRLGREREARKFWKRALELSPDLDFAQDNLDDLELPVGERNGPWSFPANYWIPEAVLRVLVGHLDRAVPGDRERAATCKALKSLEERSYLKALVPMLLDRGDPPGRELAVRIAMLAQTPELLSALEEFALGQRGPDALRLEAANFLASVDVLPTGRTSLWRDGRWSEMLLCGFELYAEPHKVHSPRVEDLAGKGLEALRETDGERAEYYFTQALKIEPDAPDLLNNLAAAYRFQGRNEESERIALDIHDRFPDYFFGRVNVANLHVQNHELEKARELLLPLLEEKRLHVTEFTALCEGFVQLSLAEGNFDAARCWLEMCEEVDPDHPMLDACRPLMLGRGMGRFGSRNPFY
jgi:tetratricopeptide (TPR) repeat protein